MADIESKRTYYTDRIHNEFRSLGAFLVWDDLGSCLIQEGPPECVIKMRQDVIPNSLEGLWEEKKDDV